MDPRDQALLAACPVVAAPRFGALPDMGNGQRIIVARNGWFVQTKLDWLDSIVALGHDQPQMRNRCQDCHARSQHNARLPGVRSQPALQALRRCHATVQRHHVAFAKAGHGTERVGVVEHALAHQGDGFKPPVRVHGEARHGVAVVHVPAVLAAEVMAQIAPGEQGRIGAIRAIALWVGIQVVGTE